VAQFLAGKFVKSQALSGNLLHRLNEPLSVFTLSLVEPERLLVKVAEPGVRPLSHKQEI
jgi:hypothetical protein